MKHVFRLFYGVGMMVIGVIAFIIAVGIGALIGTFFVTFPAVASLLFIFIIAYALAWAFDDDDD